jgi:hypothetical protein
MGAREVLRQFSLGQLSPYQAMRVLVEHDGWLVPVGWAASVLQRDKFETVHLEMGQPTFPDGQLWLFTDADALARAREALAGKIALGTYVSPVSGIDVFGRLSNGIVLEINPGLPREETFFAQGAAITATRILGQALGLSRALATAAGDLAERLMTFEGYLVLARRSTGKLVTIRPDDGADQLVVFTARDAADAFVPRLGVDDVVVAPVEAPKLIAHLAQLKAGCYLCTSTEGELRTLPAGVFELLAEPSR